MADLSADADFGSNHLLGHVLGNRQTISMANYHVSIMSVYVEVFSSHLVFWAIITVHLYLSTLDTVWITDHRLRTPVSLSGTIESINRTNDSIASSNSTDNETARSLPILYIFHPHIGQSNLVTSA